MKIEVGKVYHYRHYNDVGLFSACLMVTKKTGIDRFTADVVYLINNSLGWKLTNLDLSTEYVLAEMPKENYPEYYL